MNEGPTFETLKGEFELVIARHNELASASPPYFASVVYHLADMVRAKHHIPIDDVVDQGDGLWLVHLGNEGDFVAGLGIVDQPDRVADLDVVHGPGGPFFAP